MMNFEAEALQGYEGESISSNIRFSLKIKILI